MMLDLALTYPEYRDTAARVKIVETTAAEYYGTGYQDVQNRVPKIDEHLRRPRLAAEGADGRGADAHLRRVSRTGGRAPARGLIIIGNPAKFSSSFGTSASPRETDAARAEDRRRHAARHARRRAQPRGAAEASTAPTRRFCSRSAPITPDARSSGSSGPGFFGKVRRTSVVRHYGVQDAAVRHAAARPRHRPPRRRRDARDPRRGLRGRHPHLGPRPLAGRRRRRRRRVDARRNAAGLRPLHRHLRDGAADARRRRLADERPRAAPHAAARLRVLLRRPRHVIRTCRCGTAS